MFFMIMAFAITIMKDIFFKILLKYVKLKNLTHMLKM
jgi:hypothetical protein